MLLNREFVAPALFNAYFSRWCEILGGVLNLQEIGNEYKDQKSGSISDNVCLYHLMVVILFIITLPSVIPLRR